MRDSRRDVGNEYFLSLYRQWIGYEKGFWVTFRVRVVVRVYDSIRASGGLFRRHGQDLEEGGRVVTKRIVHIGIPSKDYMHKRMLAIAKGQIEQLAGDPRVWFTSWEALARVFSKQNMMLIEILREKDLESITALARAVGREKTNV